MNVTYCKADVRTQKCLRCIILPQTHGRDIELTPPENFLSLVLILPPDNNYLMQLSEITAGLKGRVLVLFPFIFFSVVRG